jgi:hypothetical protein
MCVCVSLSPVKTLKTLTGNPAKHNAMQTTKEYSHLDAESLSQAFWDYCINYEDVEKLLHILLNHHHFDLAMQFLLVNEIRKIRLSLDDIVDDAARKRAEEKMRETP